MPADSPVSSVPVSNVVLIHGGWHCSTSWGAVVPLLRTGGHCVVSPDLPGHGWKSRFPENYFSAGQPHLETEKTTLEGITLGMAAATVLDALQAVRSASNGKRPVVLVSHSSSGAIASLAARPWTASSLVIPPWSAPCASIPDPRIRDIVICCSGNSMAMWGRKRRQHSPICCALTSQ